MNLKCNVTQCTYNNNDKCTQDEIEINFACDDYEYAYCSKYEESLDSLRENYKIIKIEDKSICEHDYIIFSMSYLTTPIDCFKAIIEDLILDGNKGRIKLIIDNLVARGNSSNRFIECIVDCKEKDVVWGSFNTYNSCKNSELRKFNAKIYSNYPDVIKNSVLISTQQKMILKGLGV